MKKLLRINYKLPPDSDALSFESAVGVVSRTQLDSSSLTNYVFAVGESYDINEVQKELKASGRYEYVTETEWAYAMDSNESGVVKMPPFVVTADRVKIGLPILVVVGVVLFLLIRKK